MVNNHDASDVRGLEDVFRSQEFSRSSGPTGGGSGGMTALEGRDDALLRRMFGHASGALRDVRRDDSAGSSAARQEITAAAPDAASTSPHDSEAASSGGGSAVGGKGAAVPGQPLWKRESGRYWTIAAFSALVALVVAGVTADTGRHGPSNRSAQGAYGTARPRGGAHTPGPTSTAPTAPGSLTGGVGSALLALGTPSPRTVRSGNEPAGHVTLSGAATTTGTLPAASGGSPGGGSPGGAPGSSGTSPTAPGEAAVGNTVAAVGSSVTGLANQVGSAVPAAAPATSAVANTVSGVLNSIDQAVSPAAL